MSKYNYTDFEKQLNTVLAHQSSELSSIHFPNTDSLDESISSSEALLKKLWIMPKKVDRKSKRIIGQIGRQAIIMRMRAERVIKAMDILKNRKF